MWCSHSVKSQHNTVKSVEFVDNNDLLGMHFTSSTVNSNVYSAIQMRYVKSNTVLCDFKYTPCNIKSQFFST